MNAVLTHRMDRSDTDGKLWPRIVMPVVLFFACSDGIAQTGDLPAASFATTSSTASLSERTGGPQMEITATSLPRFENIDGATRASRLDLTLLPPGRSSLGLAFGVTSMEGPGFAPTGVSATTPNSVNLGLHWRYTLDSNNRVDITAWRRIQQPDALSLIQTREPSYGARVEMRIQPVLRNGLVADKGFLGVQLESGARVTLRRSHGKPMIYYRTKF
jgi:hypothetical protein